ncbi:MAG: protein GlmU [Desulfobacterium sp.]
MNCKNGINTCDRLMAKGVQIPLPNTLFIGPEVDIDRISGNGVTLYPGTRIIGENTLIMSRSTLGQEAPVTLDDCYVGPDTHLKGGFFQDAVFVGKNTFGSGAHVRGGTILEEEAGAAHTVGLKQTILFPFVTLGSLINFCDLLMAGGTSRKNHSEVGSSYIHFNYTPSQDKATPSMVGNVHQGVMLDQSPIFLGGQGGLVGPRALAFGTVTAAGTICRRDVLRPNRLILGGGMKSASFPNVGNIYRDVHSVFKKNCSYISSLCALLAWYQQVRSLFVTDVLSRALLHGMQVTLKKCIKERIHRLDGFCIGVEASLAHHLQGGSGKKTKLVNDHERLLAQWAEIRECMETKIMPNSLPAAPASFLGAVEKEIATHGVDYVQVIQSLDPDVRLLGIQWLEKITKDVADNG